MPLYELRTYTLRVGTMAEAVKLYQEIGFPALQKGSHEKKLIGYFQADTGTINQIVHLWKFDDDADHVAPLELTAKDDIALRIDAVNLENRLRYIQTDCRDRLHDLPPRIVGALTAPTSMALTCRWRSRPQHQ
jgi:hypothetical protein